jgi:hypothetical protein
VKAIVAFFISLFSVLGIYTDRYDEAQAAYRNGDFAQAETILGPLVRENRDDATILMAYVYLQLGKLDQSEKLFQVKYQNKIGGSDIPFGLALVARARQEFAQARKFGLEAAKDRSDVKEFLDRLPSAQTVIARATVRGAFARPERLDAPFVARDGFLRDSKGEPIVVKGVNMGVALPGKYPSEFPLEQKTYREWFDLIGAMNANVVRLYTILPPTFYLALRDYNLAHAAKPLYVIHGVWTELPEDTGFEEYRGGFTDQFLTEAKRVVHVVHGRLDLPAKPGHASGSYTADVSPWVLAYVIGREWEPYSVAAYDRKPDAPRSFKGQYLETAGDSPFEAWLAGFMDAMISFEMSEYHAQRPMAFTNWPTTDPLHHVTEATKDEENALRVKRGEPVDIGKINEYDNDGVGIDATLIRATANYPAGTFASFHAYPYYPDFMNLDPEYNRAVGPFGRSNYSGYLRDLKKHHQTMPILISEVGVPSSRGVAHLQAQGDNHGGHSELGQAERDVKIYGEVLESGMAGAMMFAWLDEWFKRNWLYSDFELPYDRNRLWHSIMDAEQNYGIVAAQPANQPRLEADRSRWQNIPPLQDGALRVKAHADAEYLHLLFETPLQPSDTLEFALDTHPMGGASLPWTAQNKPEFRGRLNEIGGSLETLASYRPFRPVELIPGSEILIYNARAKPEFEQKFVPILTEPNRRRIGRDGTIHPGQRYDSGTLRAGSDPDGARDPMTDYRWDPTGVQVRIPWTLILVSDPSSRSVFDGSTDAGSRRVADIGLNVRVGGLNASPMRFTWETWEEQPAFELRLKPAYGALQRLWATIK